MRLKCKYIDRDKTNQQNSIIGIENLDDWNFEFSLNFLLPIASPISLR